MMNLSVADWKQKVRSKVFSTHTYVDMPYADLDQWFCLVLFQVSEQLESLSQLGIWFIIMLQPDQLVIISNSYSALKIQFQEHIYRFHVYLHSNVSTD